MATKHPVITIQCDWNDVLRLPKSKAWISSKLVNETSQHDELTTTVNPSDGKVKINTSNNYQILSYSNLNLVLKYYPTDLKVAFIAPTKTHLLHDKGVLSTAAAENALMVSSDESDNLIVWDSRTNDVLVTLKGHGGPVYKCRFFPSGVVVLSAGADGSCRIWSAETGINPVTLKGHSMAIMDICIVERGRNVISVSRDGTAKLWDVGEARCLGNIHEGQGPVNCCTITQTAHEVQVDNEREVGTGNKLLIVGTEGGLVVGSHVAQRQELFRHQLDAACNDCAVIEVGTGNKLLIVGTEGGLVVGSHVAQRQELFRHQLDAACNACAVVEDRLLVGCDNGKIYQINVNSGELLGEWHESNSPVLSIITLSPHIFAVGRQDGTCTIASILDNFTSTRVYLTGSDCDGIRDLAFNNKWIFTACRDSKIRKYDFNQILVHFK